MIPLLLYSTNKIYAGMPLQARQKNKHNSSVLFGLLIATVGLLFLLKQFKLISFNFQIWPLFLIAGGLINGSKKGFSRPIPIALISIGIAYLIPEFRISEDVSSNQLLWPISLILTGVFIAFRARKKDNFLMAERDSFAQRFDVNKPESFNAKEETFVHIEASFGGRKEIITSKQFNGCTATAICGGAEINLMQADNLVQPMIIDLRVLLGGIEIIVPSHWEIINEVDVLLGGIEDKRNLRTPAEIGDSKKLLLRGSVTFGGLELKSY
jgi:predicted membrane protein